MTYNQLLILNIDGKILKINSTKQDNYHDLFYPPAPLKGGSFSLFLIIQLKLKVFHPLAGRKSGSIKLRNYLKNWILGYKSNDEIAKVP
jgi:hypothetical protein